MKTKGEEAQSRTDEKWRAALRTLSEAIRIRHYSPKTAETYTAWVSKNQSYSQVNDPQDLSTSDVKAFLTHLAVEKRMSASSQNQAFNALSFFFRHVLGREFGTLDGVVRAKGKPYIPVVLTRPEIDRVVQHLHRPHDLVIQLLYGCGLRLSE